MSAYVTEITQFEGTPESYPAIEGVTGDLLETCWTRVEHYCGQRWAPRRVVWTLRSGGGEWKPPLGPILISEAFGWKDGDWQPVTLRRGPFGLMLPCGNVQIEASVGSNSGASIPAAVKEAIKRLAAYLTAQSPVPAGARSYSANVGQLSEAVSIDPAAMARALQYSGAADLLRAYRKASHEPV
ncbi:hypothetical protein D6851_05865 [Altericroceibacterium spongiae]|uniref:Uncharacterized protein n=1 Tax=Altericroceibacterium spongiae TaxID=2320269 RepID=A0A420EPW9_9SPHN|nr:hypothetical protein [Altericroceibacterium spongiae]RKF22722.1 hypothetical protein D6851_05865 [Altericroceibacterium spongiae]